MHPRAILTVLATFLALATSPVRATDEHTYTRDEYAIIQNGLAPNQRMSLASHGDGDGGRDNFHVWLMAEPSHRRLGRLDDIGSSNNPDTGPHAHRAMWAPDSRHVGVNWRSNRHVLELNLYAAENGRTRLISGPSLFRDVTSRDVGSEENFGYRVSTIEWIGPRRFRLSEHHRFKTGNPGFMRLIGRYGKVKDTFDDGRSMVEFSAEADCVLIPGDRYRIVDLRVGKFDQ